MISCFQLCLRDVSKHTWRSILTFRWRIFKVVAKAYANAKRNPKLTCIHVDMRWPSKRQFQSSFSEKSRLETVSSCCRLFASLGWPHRHCSCLKSNETQVFQHRGVEIVDTDQGVGNIYESSRFDRASCCSWGCAQNVGIDDVHVDVFELHDCFAIAEVLMYEAIGLARPGRGVDFVERASIGGDCPVNADGLLALGIPLARLESNNWKSFVKWKASVIPIKFAVAVILSLI